MAEASISVDQDQFSCPVCHCGHSYCMVCINKHWDEEDQKGVHSCPQCRETFTLRPVLRRNNMLAEVVEKVKKTELQAASPALCYAGPGDVECDFCTGRKRKAIKSCLVCLASYCETHVQSHYQSPAFKKHQLVKASTRLQERICSQHNKMMGIYCRTDQSCICYLCMMHKHKGHDTVEAAAERKKKQSSRSVWPRSLSVGRTDRRCRYIRSATQRSTGVVTQSKTTADMPCTLSPCSIKQLQEQFLSEQQEADAITQPLLDTENGFIKDLELYLDHRDTVALRKRELLHRRWTQCVWRPVQRSVEQRFAHCCCEGAEPMRMMLAHYINYCNAKGFVSLESYDPQEYEPFLLRISRPHSFQVSTPPLKDPLSLQSRARMKEKRAILRCQTGHVNDRQQQEEGMDKSCLQRASRVSRGTVYLATAEGRCFQPECWSSIGPS